MTKRYSVIDYIYRLKALNLLSYEDADLCRDEVVQKLSFDSRDVSEGTLFFCKGLAFKVQYAQSALEQGACALVMDDDCLALSEADFTGRLIVVKEIRRAMAVLSAMFNDYAQRSFPLIGITGTKGKSTTISYLSAIMDNSAVCGGDSFGLISTIETYDGINRFESHLTTPEAIELGMRLSNMKSSGIKAAVMEVSSQALKYDRTYGIEFDTACFTNFGLDHIGETEHSDIEDYLRSKLMIFRQCRNALVNLDSERIEDILAAAMCVPFTTFAKDTPGADYTICNVRKEHGQTVFELDGKPGKTEGFGTITLGMPGLFNVYNAAAAAILARGLGATDEEIRKGLLEARASGRCEAFENEKRELVIISDYAHNALSFEALCQSVLQEYPGYAIEAVYGASGGKGYSRRSELPRIAAKYARFSWITEDDPGLEDPAQICAEVYDNLQKLGGKGKIIVDRTEAITEAVKNATAKTVILLLAKGNDSYMIRGREYVPVKSDTQLAKELAAEDF